MNNQFELSYSDKEFLVALAFTASSESNTDIIAFRDKVSENQNTLMEYDNNQPVPQTKAVSAMI